MTNNKIKLVKINKEDKIQEIEVTESFTFNPNKRRIGYYLEDALPILDRKSKEKYQSSLDSIYDSINGNYLIETDDFRVTVIIQNIDL
jgi:hypothetical protein